MSQEYLADQRDAHQEILESGGMATITWETTTPPTPAQVDAGQAATVTSGSGKIAMTVFPLSRRFMAADTFEAQRLIFQHSRRFIMSAYKTPTVPKVGDRIVGWEKTNWTIDSIAPLMPDGEHPILYTGTMKE